ncbi:MAG: hypothetical protein QM691_13130 [Opitutaceae bacterium]
MPVLAGPPVESVFGATKRSDQAGAFALARSAEWTIGVATGSPAGDVEAVTHRLYAELFAAARGLHLARIWNYVPAINAPTVGGLETYRAFSRGRSLAFEAEFGRGFHRHVPAASAVGTDSANLTVVFAATARVPRHVENPRQIPAYEYPPEHGPRPPTFARATVVPAAEGRADLFISGTSSILGHATIAPTETLPQLACTLENLREIAVACGSGADLAAGRAVARHFKVYLRAAADLPAVRAVLERELLRPEDRVSYLRSDICRRELNVEIEATLLGVVLTGAMPAAR